MSKIWHKYNISDRQTEADTQTDTHTHTHATQCNNIETITTANCILLTTVCTFTNLIYQNIVHIVLKILSGSTSFSSYDDSQ